jgi:hypothetical protein
MAELRESVGMTGGQGTALHAHGHGHHDGHDHAHDHPHAHDHAAHRAATSPAAAAAAAPRVRHSMFLASAVERLGIAVLLAGLIWAGILWAIA